ncbi:D-ribose pyranase [Virgibacillus necropolis]|uniref:D-ribose pyranase n=1 Tax=Virgibacillus necropolis TaxID=163877 RepID=A0A221M995_9BACI|nr:D-ribose pyranase [Virgibacillus necropolis]ASN04192.1 D-ribose pyranase [Virgibacillus necropolis]
MKKAGILHPEMSHLVASLGHTDYVVLGDKGYPVPDHTKRIDLGITEDLPTVLQVLKVIETEFTIDRMIVTEEMLDISPERYKVLQQSYPNILFEKVTHQEFKELTNHSKGIIKTGDTCPYANMIIVSG